MDRTFDIVVADYLLGAVEMYWPHGADGMMDRLVGATKQGGYMMITGIEPYEFVLDRENNDDRLVLDIEAIGESAAFIAGESTYREVLESWVRRQLERYGFRVVASKQVRGGKERSDVLTATILNTRTAQACTSVQDAPSLPIAAIFLTHNPILFALRFAHRSSK